MIYRPVPDRDRHGPTADEPLIPAWRLAVPVGLAVLLAALVTATLLARFIERSMLDQHAATLARLVASTTGVERPEAPALAVGADVDGADLILRQLARMPGVARVDAVGPDLRVFWSSDAAVIGRPVPATDAVRRALTGEPAAVFDGPVEDAVGPRVRTYVPIPGGAGRVTTAGAILIHQRPAALAEAIAGATRRTVVAVTLGASLVFVALLAILHRGTRLARARAARLVMAEKLAAAETIAAGLSQGLREPAAAIRGDALRALAAAPPHEASTALARILDELDRLEAWGRRHLLPACADPMAVGEADLREAIGAALADLRTTVTGTEALPRVRLHPEILSQVVSAVVANAIEAMPAGGTLWINAERAGPTSVRLRVDDDGPGLAPDEVDRALVPLASAKPGRIGLGLPVARDILGRHGAALRLASAPGRGTTVELSLPVANGASRASAHSAQ
jgi:signal transduction histidine kinase